MPPHVGDFCEHCRPKADALLQWFSDHVSQRIGLIRRLRTEADAGPTTTPEDTLREAGISSKRQAKYQRRMSSLLAGRE